MKSVPRTKRRMASSDGAPTLEVAGAAATIRLCRPGAHNRIDPDDIPVIRGQLDDGEMLRVGFLTELVSKAALPPRVAAYVAALQACEPAVVASMKQQLNAIAAGVAGAAQARTSYKASLQSPELRQRLAPVLAKPK